MTAQIVLLVNLEYRKIFCHNCTKLRAKSANKISEMNIWRGRGAFCVKQCRTNLRYPAEPCTDVQHLPHLYGVFLLPSGFLPLKVLVFRKYMSETSGKEYHFTWILISLFASFTEKINNIDLENTFLPESCWKAVRSDHESPIQS